jgi:hypothetical protein
LSFPRRRIGEDFRILRVSLMVGAAFQPRSVLSAHTGSRLESRSHKNISNAFCSNRTHH